MTIEETHQTTQSVLNPIELLDKDRYTRMCEISCHRFSFGAWLQGLQISRYSILRTRHYFPH
jgi:hypothetical protein